MDTSTSSRLAALLERNRAYIPGGISSANRLIDPLIFGISRVAATSIITPPSRLTCLGTTSSP